MYSYKGRLMTLNVNKGSINNIKFDNEIIQDIIDTQPIVPVTINFSGSGIGATRKFERVVDDLVCTFDINIPNMDRLELFLVPMGMVKLNDIGQDEGNGVRTIKRMSLLEVSITSTPLDPSLTKIEKE
jgi:hypothetical protein